MSSSNTVVQKPDLKVVAKLKMYDNLASTEINTHAMISVNYFLLIKGINKEMCLARIILALSTHVWCSTSENSEGTNIVWYNESNTSFFFFKKL